MRNVTILFIFIFVVFSCSSIGQQTYSSHRVSEGETVSSIANKYNVTVYEIYKLNPEAKGQLYPGLVLILPGGNADTTGSNTENENFIFHTVQKGETLYNLTKKYGVTESQIKRYNQHLYSAELRNGEIIKILKPKASEAISETSKPTTTNRKHIVKPKETKYGLASMYGISVSDLENLNPGIVDGLQIGDILNVPDKAYTNNAVIEDSKYGFYEVKPKETLYSLIQRWNLSEEQLTTLNPSLKDGLKSGMVLTIPKSKLTNEIKVSTTGGAINLSKNLKNLSVKNVAVMMPFNLGSVQVDSEELKKSALKSDRVMNIALDFYSGVLMAVDSAKALGISSNLYVYDTQYSRSAGNATNDRKIEEIINRKDFDKMNVVIGPLLTSNVEKASAMLRNKGIPVVSPIVPSVTMSSNLFQSRPDDKILKDQMINFIKQNGRGKNIIIVADSKNQNTKQRIQSLYPDAKIVSPRSSGNGYYIRSSDLVSNLSRTIQNWVILESNDIALISNITTTLSTQLSGSEITLLTTDKGSAYDSDDVSNITLMKLNFHFPSVSREYDYTHESFVDAYTSKYGYAPSSYAVRGYDITFDTLLRLAASESLYTAADSGYITQYVENKFNYVQDPASSGYYNKASYIIKYGKDLEEIVVEVSGDTNANTGYLKN